MTATDVQRTERFPPARRLSDGARSLAKDPLSRFRFATLLANLSLHISCGRFSHRWRSSSSAPASLKHSLRVHSSSGWRSSRISNTFLRNRADPGRDFRLFRTNYHQIIEDFKPRRPPEGGD